jgi:hypothetical protein
LKGIEAKVVACSESCVEQTTFGKVTGRERKPNLSAPRDDTPRTESRKHLDFQRSSRHSGNL